MGDVKNIIMRFPVEDGTPRMFVAFMDKKKGISIQDVDNDVIVAKGLMKGAMPSVQMVIEAMFQGIDWKAFSRWLSSREQYERPFDVYDLGQDRPSPGNAMAQIRYTPQNGDWIDARTAGMVAADADPRDPVSFPPASLEDMALAMAAHDKVLDPEDGKSRLSWSIPVDPASLAGAPGDGELTDPELDEVWAEHAATDEYRDEVLTILGERIFDRENSVYHVADDGVVSLESHRSLPMSFGSMEELSQKCKGMRDALVPLYAEVRTIDTAMKAAPGMISEIALEKRQSFENDRNIPAEVDM